MTETKRIIWLDVIRLIAMLMVIGVHCIDPFYISPAMRDNPEYTRWAAIYGSLFRPSVPLFTMMTGLLLLPVRQTAGVFYKKRILRILFPMLIWSVLYNLFPWFTGVLGLPKEIIGDFFCYVQGSESQALAASLKDVAMIPFQFSFKENHMWYMYLLLGLYLYMPFFSAWVEKAGEKEKRIFLSLWGVSLFLPYLQAYVAPLFGVRFLLGEATWNAYGLFYYFAGFNGYLILGHYLKNAALQWSTLKTCTICLVLFALGYAVTFSGFSSAAANPASTEEDMELFFTFCSPNVAIMTIAVFLLLRQVTVVGPCPGEHDSLRFRHLHHPLLRGRSVLPAHRPLLTAHPPASAGDGRLHLRHLVGHYGAAAEDIRTKGHLHCRITANMRFREIDKAAPHTQGQPFSCRPHPQRRQAK